MTGQGFWEIIEKARRGGVLEVQSLRKLLRALSRSELELFEHDFGLALDALDTHEIQTALLKNREVCESGFLSADGFDYIRAGIVARGRDVYSRVLSDPGLLVEGAWREREELLYVVQEIVGDQAEESLSTFDIPRWRASVSKIKYPFVRDRPLEEGFPVASFGWLRCEVVDRCGPPRAIIEYEGGEVPLYSEYMPARREYLNVALKVQEALRGHIDFRRLPHLTLELLALVGDSESTPHWYLLPDAAGEELDLGVAWGVPRGELSGMSSREIELRAREDVLRAVQFYFEGHPVEQQYVAEARVSLGW